MIEIIKTHRAKKPRVIFEVTSITIRGKQEILEVEKGHHDSGAHIFEGRRQYPLKMN